MLVATRWSHHAGKRQATDTANPAGIVDVYTRGGPEDGWHRLWCGCQIHWGIGIEHGQGVRALRVCIREHDVDHHPPAPAPTPASAPQPKAAPQSRPPDEHLF